MKKLLFTIVLILLTGPLKAQYDSSVYTGPRLSIQLDLMQLFNPEDPSWMLSSEIFLNKRFSLIPEVGFFTTIRAYEPVEVSAYIKLQQGLRYYVEDFNTDKLNIYFGANFQYRNLTIRDTYILGFECEEFGSCVHYRNYEGEIATNRMVASFEAGGEFMIGPRAILGWSAMIGRQYYSLDRAQLFGGKLVEPDRFLTESKLSEELTGRITFRVGYLIF
jgi:hypothetical protein